jgi:hypothetical protein
VAKTNNTRRFSGGGPRPDNNEIKQREAKERAEAWSSLTPQQQLAALDRRPGESKRQRARLQALIEKKKHAPKVEAKGAEPVGQLLTPEESPGNIKAKERRAAQQAKRPAK